MLKSRACDEAFEERAAIMEFDGGLSREDAEREACALVSKRPSAALRVRSMARKKHSDVRRKGRKMNHNPTEHSDPVMKARREYVVRAQTPEEARRLITNGLASSELAAARAMQAIEGGKGIGEHLDTSELIQCLRDQAEAVNDGDLRTSTARSRRRSRQTFHDVLLEETLNKLQHVSIGDPSSHFRKKGGVWNCVEGNTHRLPTSTTFHLASPSSASGIPSKVSR